MSERIDLSITLRSLPAIAITPEGFEPFGQVIFATPDGKPYDVEDAQLHLSQGTPRFYIMRLHHRGQQFSQITRHRQCTQCLGALSGQDWLMAVARDNGTHQPALNDIAAFQIPGNCFIKLNRGTWHAGPYFEQDYIDFYNLELSDTNITDHQTCDLAHAYGMKFQIAPVTC
jgi:ureidoglycolate hydrolase